MITRSPTLHQPGGGAVQAHHPRARGPGHRVGLEAGAVVDVHDVDLFVLEDVGGEQQLAVDRDRADVVQIAVRDRGAMDLRLQHHPLHGAHVSQKTLLRKPAGGGRGRAAGSGRGRRGMPAPTPPVHLILQR